MPDKPKPYTSEDIDNIVVLATMEARPSDTLNSESALITVARRYFQGMGWSFHQFDLARWEFFSDLLSAYNSRHRPSPESFEERIDIVIKQLDCLDLLKKGPK
jgi:hypothetical protein